MVVVKRVAIRPSAGMGVNDPIQAALTTYCNELRAASPVYLPRWGSASLDRSQLFTALALKAESVGGTVSGVVVDWSNFGLHEVASTDPKVWNNINAVALLHSVAVTRTDGTTVTQFFSISYEP
jgi:hypothetical protein